MGLALSIREAQESERMTTREEQLYSAEDVATLLGVTPALVHEFERRGLLAFDYAEAERVYTASHVMALLLHLAEERQLLAAS
jgi:hypothetical protein